MSPQTILLLVLGYFAILLLIARITGKSDSNATFFRGNRSSPWFVVAFGMIGASLSGVTFISVPGWVEGSQFAYMQMVLGYFAGYVVIAHILLPLYYRLNLTSIYSYLESRFGLATYKTGASFFLLSRIIGASFRLFLVANVLQIAVFDAMDVPFWATVIGTIVLIWIYTFRGGIKTIVYTDTLQTTFMLAALGLTIYYLSDAVIPEGIGLIDYISDHPNSKIFFTGEEQGGFWKSLFNGASSQHFLKQFLGGMFITICMTGLDQDMMQKNLTCRSLGDAQKNMYGFSLSLIVINLVFLSLGILLYDYASMMGIDAANDDLYPTIALSEGIPGVVLVFFIIGLIASAYSSADSALTSLTTSFSVDILGMNTESDDKGVKNTRRMVHILMSVLILIVILLFKYTAPKNVISELFKVAGYTYGPLLGLYAFGLFSKLRPNDILVPIAALLSPVITYVVNLFSETWFNYTFGFELLLFNGLVMVVLLLLTCIGEDQKPTLQATDQL